LSVYEELEYQMFVLIIVCVTEFATSSIWSCDV